MLSQRGGASGRLGAELRGGLGGRRNRANADILAVEEREPVGERPRAKRVLQLGDPRLELPPGELRQAGDLAQPLPEARLERRNGQLASVGGLVEPVAARPLREEAAWR